MKQKLMYNKCTKHKKAVLISRCMRIRLQLSENKKYINVLGGPETYNHYPVEFTEENQGKNEGTIGNVKSCIDEAVVAQGSMKTQPAKFTLSGDGLCVGYDS